MSQPWGREQLDFLCANYGHMTAKQIRAAMPGIPRSISAIRQKAAYLGLSRQEQHLKHKHEAQRSIIAMAERGNTWTHRTKGGSYCVEDYAFGSGKDHGRVFVVYASRMGSMDVYARDYAEWREKMIEVVA
jgi:beta-lactamase class D